MFIRMKPTTTLLVCALALTFSSPALAHDGFFSFLRSDAAARPAALSGAFVTMSEDPSAVFYNPASVGTMPEGRAQMSIHKNVLDINAGTATYVLGAGFAGDSARMAFSANYVNYGSFERADQFGVVTGDFGGYDVALSASLGSQFDSTLFWGVTAKYVSVGLDNVNASAAAVDVGLLYLMPEQRVALGFSVLHAGGVLSDGGDDNVELPLDVRLGVSHRLRGLPLLLNLTFHHLADEGVELGDMPAQFALGGELYLSKVIRLRVGYDNQRRDALAGDTKGMAGFSGGVGITTTSLDIDYSVSSFGAIGSQHRLSVDLEL